MCGHIIILYQVKFDLWRLLTCFLGLYKFLPEVSLNFRVVTRQRLHCVFINHHPDPVVERTWACQCYFGNLNAHDSSDWVLVNCCNFDWFLFFWSDFKVIKSLNFSELLVLSIHIGFDFLPEFLSFYENKCDQKRCHKDKPIKAVFLYQLYQIC